MAMTTLSTTIDGNSAGRVDVVVRQLSESSHSQVRGMVDHGCVSINGAMCQSGATTVVVGDLVSIRFDRTQRYREKKKCWDDRTFTVSFEDDHLIVVDKSAGTLTVPTDSNERNTLVDRVSIYLSHSRSKREAWLVHRLDRDVSGLVIFGKHEQVATRLIEQFKQRVPQYMLRHKVKSGMTGWAQVNGWRGDTSIDKRIEYDLYYIEHWSVSLDFKILWLTVFRVFFHRHAY
jgi:23S rRNA pseudouridine1911/1915/1917 synthase